ncbi:MAG: imidazole glycerol phosphate synthase subunit HisH [Proteobacteria bacterium]|nr:imidazole glycerol phosphate synthase subunit HisH [Pseudomonadota bacterium]
MITIINTGGANLASVSNALDRLGRTWTLTRDADTIRSAERVILPGVGAARDSMDRLQEAGLIDVIRNLTQPTMGICLGMQLLFERSEEGDTECLGIIPGTVRRMESRPGLRIPHMGWNAISPRSGDEVLFAGIAEHSHFYFVHSYAAPMGDWVCATVDHGNALPAAVRRGNFYGCQFHPERSALAGAEVLKNFLRI